MKNQIKYIEIILLFWLTGVHAQEQINKFHQKVSRLAVEIQNETIKEKTGLKLKVDSLNVLEDNKTLTEKQVQELKSRFAYESSVRLEQKINQLNDSLTTLVQNSVEYAVKSGKILHLQDSVSKLDSDDSLRNMSISYNYKKDGKKLLGERRTTFRLGGAYGMSNLVTEGAFANSDIRYIPSVFFQGGFYLKTRLLKNNSLLYLKYGLAGETSELKPTRHRYFKAENGQTVIIEHEKELRKSRLSIRSIQLPVYLEFDFTKPKIDNNTGKKYFRSQESWRIGIGGYINFTNKNGKGHQVYRYREDGVQYRVEQKEDLGIAKTRFGFGTYFGYGAWALLIQYELTPLFTNNDINQNIYSLGIRWDI